VTPLLVVSDLQRSVDFYCQKLGFVEPALHGEPPCFAMMNRDGFDLMLSLAEDPTQVHPHGRNGVWDVYVSVSDVAVEAAALEAAGVGLDKGPTDAFYSMREIEILDPDGYRLCLAQDLSGEPLRVAAIWDGVLDLGTARLRLVLKLAPSEDGLVGRLDSLDQGALNLPVDAVTREGASLRFSMEAIGAAFEGSLSDDGNELSGRWSQRGNTWPLTFRRQ
jgi:catechol 2,3-dioxygenase-like lactoylglutathione lyase family enzyme